MKTGTIIGLTMGGLALGITTVVFLPKLLKKSNGSTGGGSGSSDNGDNSGNTSTSSGGGVAGAVNTAVNVFNQGNAVVDTASQYVKKYMVERVDEDANAKVITVFFNSPRPPANTVKAGSKIKLSNMDKYNGFYTVKMIWNDAGGNQGAIYLNSDRVTENRESNNTWKNKGEILTY